MTVLGSVSALCILASVVLSIPNLRETLQAYQEARAKIRQAKAEGRARVEHERALTRELQSILNRTDPER